MKKIYYRYAKLEDAKFLYNLRTSKDAKKFFFKKKNFTFKQHIIWLTNKISKKKDKLIVFYFKPQDYFGVVRYESIKIIYLYQYKFQEILRKKDQEIKY